jgi:translocation and assembly module TamB
MVATGSASLKGEVRAAKGGAPAADLGVTFGRFEVKPGQGGNPAPYLRGRGLRLTVSSRDLDLTTPVSDLRARVDLKSGEVPDLTAYNAFLPAGAGVSILSGAGTVRLGLSLDAAKQTGEGEAVLPSDAAGLRFQDLTVNGRLGLHGRLASVDLESRRFGLAGSTLTLDGVTYASSGEEGGKEEPPWWAHLEVTDGSMVWKRPPVLDGTVRIKMKSADPILALFAQKRRYVGWFQDLVSIEDITAGGKLRLDGDVLEVAPLQVLGNRFDLRSRLRFSRAGAQGDLYVRYRRLSLGIALDKGKRDFKLRRPLEWYESRAGSP